MKLTITEQGKQKQLINNKIAKVDITIKKEIEIANVTIKNMDNAVAMFDTKRNEIIKISNITISNQRWIIGNYDPMGINAIKQTNLKPIININETITNN